MRRRELIALVSGAAPFPFHATAQQAAGPVIGFLGSNSSAAFAPHVDAFRRGLAEAGYAEGQNVTIEYRWADDRYERLPALAAELVARRVAVIHATDSPATKAAKAATASIPVIFVVGSDPVGAGLVKSLSRPGENLTGMYLYIGGLVAKKLGLLREAAPAVDTIGLLVNPGTPSSTLDSAEWAAVAPSSGKPSAEVLNARTEAEIDAVFAYLGQSGTAGAVVGTDSFYFAHRRHLAAVAAARRVPTIYYAREFATAGGLMSYGANIPDVVRRAGIYTALVLKGGRPIDMPVQQPTKFEFVINLRTANALGLKVPALLLAQADEVIE
jgi:putative tryptophan/tyrosine transport system substrate-binding protein